MLLFVQAKENEIFTDAVKNIHTDLQMLLVDRHCPDKFTHMYIEWKK